MELSLLMFALCGAAGALIYSFPVFLKNITKVPPTQFSTLHLVFAVFVGSCFAAIFTRIVGYHFPWTIRPEPWPLSMVIGLCSNPLVPVIVRKVQGWAEAFEGKKT